MLNIKLLLWCSTSDVSDYLVKLLVGPIERVAQTAVEWGYDGIEFLPDPLHIPKPQQVDKALRQAGTTMPVVTTGLMHSHGLALLHRDPGERKKSINIFKQILDFGGHFQARVNLGISRGDDFSWVSSSQLDRMAEDIFGELADHAEKSGSVIMLEPAEAQTVGFINTVEEALAWVKRINSPAFNLMLDTNQLFEAEPSIEHGIRMAKGRADHIHLYDPNRWPPGVLVRKPRLDWDKIAEVLQDVGFRGTGSVVLAPDGDSERAARQSLAYLRVLFEKAALSSGRHGAPKASDERRA
jgi:sugar phosphate isomerase/epimerase